MNLLYEKVTSQTEIENKTYDCGPYKLSKGMESPRYEISGTRVPPNMGSFLINIDYKATEILSIQHHS